MHRLIAAMVLFLAFPAWGGDFVTRNIEKQGPGQYKVFSRPVAFKNGAAYAPIDAAHTETVSVDGVQYVRRGKNTRIVDLKKSGGNDGFIVFRPDEGGQSLAISLVSVEFDGQAQDSVVDAPVKENDYTQDMGALLVRSTRYSTRLLIPAVSSISTFKIVFRIETQGLSMHEEAGQYWFTANNRALFRLATPCLLSASTLEILSDHGRPLPGVRHSLATAGPGAYTYTKEHTVQFADLVLPPNFYIDAAAFYGGTADGWTAETNASWAACRSAATATWGTLDSQARQEYAYDAELYQGAYYIFRNLDWFPLTGLSGEILEATLYIHGYQNQAGGVVCQKSTAEPPLDPSDYNKFSLDSGEWGRVVSWNANGYNAFSINALGLAELNAAMGGTICVGSRHEFDYDNTQPTGNSYSGRSYAEEITEAPYMLLNIRSLGHPWDAQAFGAGAYDGPAFGTGARQ